MDRRSRRSFWRRIIAPAHGILFPFGDLTGVLREAGIPLREGLHEGNGPAWFAATVRPDLFLHEEWALAFSGDEVATALRDGRCAGRTISCGSGLS